MWAVFEWFTWCVLVRFGAFWCVLVRFGAFWCVLAHSLRRCDGGGDSDDIYCIVLYTHGERGTVVRSRLGMMGGFANLDAPIAVVVIFALDVAPRKMRE
jgi:hypothetical protein